MCCGGKTAPYCQVREDQSQWRLEKEDWEHKMTRLERDVQTRVSKVDAWQNENQAIRNDLQSFKHEQQASGVGGLLMTLEL